MSDYYTKSLTFKSTNLGQLAVLVLVFDADTVTGGGYPVVWRSSEFQSDGVSIVSVTYRNKPGYLKPGPLVNDIIVDVSASQALNLAQQTKLVQDDIGRFEFTNPEDGPAGLATVINDTNDAVAPAPPGQSITFGFGQVDPNRPLTPMYYWDAASFPSGGNIEQTLSTTLRGYITDSYDDAKIVRTPIPVPVVFDQDLSTLDNATVWILTFNSTTNQFEIKPELN